MTPERRAAKNAYERARRANDPTRAAKHAEYMRQWRKDNPDKIADIEARAAVARAPKKPEQDRTYYEKNRDALRAKAAAWRIDNPDKRAIHRANRRARKAASGGRLSRGLVQRLHSLQRGLCACCRLPLGDDFQVDHIMPLALGGANSDENIQLLRAACNNLKRAKHPIEFMQRDRGMLL